MTTPSRRRAVVATVSALCLGLGCELDLGTCESSTSTCDEMTDVRVEASNGLLICDRLQVTDTQQIKRCLTGSVIDCRDVEFVFSAPGDWVRGDERWKHGLDLVVSFPSLDFDYDALMAADQVNVVGRIQRPPNDDSVYVYEKMSLDWSYLTLKRLERGIELSFDLRFATNAGVRISVFKGHYGCLNATTVPVNIECNPM